MKILVFLLFVCTLVADPICVFTPPKGWQAAKPEGLSKYVQIGFVTKGSDGFATNVNLAVEAVDCGLKEYVHACKENYKAESETECRDLGVFKTKTETGRLLQLTFPSSWGNLVLLQAIVVKHNVAYILSASMTKKDFPEVQKEVLACLQSIQISPDLPSSIVDTTVRKKWSDLLKTLGENQSAEQNAKDWSALQEFVEKETEPLGAHWQFLALQEGHAKIYRKKRE